MVEESQRAMGSTSVSGGEKSQRFGGEEEDSGKLRLYPQLDGKYEEVVADAKLFMDTLEKLHISMGTKFMIPTIGGKELDLHRLFSEVTSRGGIEKILRDRRWKEVTAVFNFPSTATNASFVLRKYYCSLLHHYEQLIYFKARGYIPVSGGNVLSSPNTPVLALRAEPRHSSPLELQQAPANAKAEHPIVGVIDGKFESGYLVTVTIGSEKLKGVLYQAPPNPSFQNTTPTSRNQSDSLVGGVHRRRRRKKSEIKRRDPAHPKPNRSGYNFFFAEQHARLKPLHPGKDREISRMIGELWNKLTEPERVIYQEEAVKDKERYRVEMETYKEKLRTGTSPVISDAVPLSQRFPEHNVPALVFDTKMAEAMGEETVEIESSSSKSDSDDEIIAEEKAFPEDFPESEKPCGPSNLHSGGDEPKQFEQDVLY